MLRSSLVVLALVGGLSGGVSTCPADTYKVTLDKAISQGQPVSGRLMVFFITEQGRGWSRRAPMSGPFFSKPQPIASIQVHDLKPGESITIDSWEVSFPAAGDGEKGLDGLDGLVRVQAILDRDETMRSHQQGPGNLYSEVIEVNFSEGGDDAIELVLSQMVKKRAAPEFEGANLQWVEFRSELLSEFYGHDVFHRAGVAMPLQYFEKKFPQKDWPAVYVVPGYGGTHFGAVSYARMFQSQGIEDVAPMAVHIVLDPDSPLGHHGFVDSPNHGPRGTALVQELIPYLEEHFRLVRTPEGRIITGHSSGGFSSLWLQLHWPETFGGCWSSSPDPIDFHAFQMTNLYEDDNMYRDAEGEPTPSYRFISGPEGQTTVAMTVAEEAKMEHAMHPLGGSGQQWDAWEAMFSPRDEQTGYPHQMFDAKTGKIDHEVVEHWKKFDITALVAGDWDHYGPIVTRKIRLSCGTLDSYYLNRAVERFKKMVEEKTGPGNPSSSVSGGGYINLVEFADHSSIMSHISVRVNKEMREMIRKFE